MREEPLVGLDGDEALHGRELPELPGHLPDAGADLEDAAAQVLGEGVEQGAPVILRLHQGGELEIVVGRVRVGRRVGRRVPCGSREEWVLQHDGEGAEALLEDDCPAAAPLWPS